MCDVFLNKHPYTNKLLHGESDIQYRAIKGWLDQQIMTALLCLKVILPAASQAFNSEEEGVGVG